MLIDPPLCFPLTPKSLPPEEDELLRVYETDGLWLLVRKQGEDELGDGQGKLGYVPANYVDEVSDKLQCDEPR